MEQEDKLKGKDDLVNTVPSTVDMNDNSIKYYKVLISMLNESKILSNMDRYGVAKLADALADYQEANEYINDKGKLITQDTRYGEKQVVNPANQLKKEAFDRFTKLATQFGLTPSSRASLSDMALEDKRNSQDPLDNGLDSLKELEKERNDKQGGKK